MAANQYKEIETGTCMSANEDVATTDECMSDTSSETTDLMMREVA